MMTMMMMMTVYLYRQEISKKFMSTHHYHVIDSESTDHARMSQWSHAMNWTEVEWRDQDHHHRCYLSSNRLLAHESSTAKSTAGAEKSSSSSDGKKPSLLGFGSARVRLVRFGSVRGFL